MQTTRQIDRFWNARQYDRLARELLSARIEFSARLLGEIAHSVPAAALALIRLDELNQGFHPLNEKLIRTIIAAQEGDGGWGDLIVSALCLRALMCNRGQGIAIDRGIAWLANLQKKAADKFSPDIAGDMIRSVDATTADDINAAKIEVTGDTAAVAFPSASRPTPMIRVKGEWKINVKALFQDLHGSPRSFRQGLTKFAAAVNQVAAKIEQGQYTSAEDASNHLLDAYKSAFTPIPK